MISSKNSTTESRSSLRARFNLMNMEQCPNCSICFCFLLSFLFLISLCLGGWMGGGWRRNRKHLVKILLQFLDAAHVILVFNAKSHNLRISTRTIKLKRSRVSVNVLHQKLCCIFSQQPANKTKELFNRRERRC